MATAPVTAPVAPPLAAPAAAMNFSLAATPPVDPGSAAPPGLQEIYVALVAKAEEAMRWYESRQRSKKRGARSVRTAAILLGALTAIIPSLIAMLPETIMFGSQSFPALRLNPIATITGIAAATAILFDRFYGFSSSWGRYVTTYQAIQQNLEDFKIGWQKQILKLNSNMPPTQEQILAVYDYLGAFLKSVNDAVRAETEAWLGEFKGAIGDIDKAVEGQKAAAAALPHAVAAKGAIAVTLPEIESLEGSQWTLQLDNRKEEIKTGQSTATIQMLDPGIYKVRIAGRRGGKPVAAEYPVRVTAGEVTALKVDKLG